MRDGTGRDRQTGTAGVCPARLDDSGPVSVRSSPTFICFIWQRTRGVQHREPTRASSFGCADCLSKRLVWKSFSALLRLQSGVMLCRRALSLQPYMDTRLKVSLRHRGLLPDIWRQLPQKHVHFPKRSVVKEILEAGPDCSCDVVITGSCRATSKFSTLTNYS